MHKVCFTLDELVYTCPFANNEVLSLIILSFTKFIKESTNVYNTKRNITRFNYHETYFIYYIYLVP